MSTAQETAEALKDIIQPMVRLIENDVHRLAGEVDALRREMHERESVLHWVSRRLRELAESVEQAGRGE